MENNCNFVLSIFELSMENNCCIHYFELSVENLFSDYTATEKHPQLQPSGLRNGPFDAFSVEYYVSFDKFTYLSNDEYGPDNHE